MFWRRQESASGDLAAHLPNAAHAQDLLSQHRKASLRLKMAYCGRGIAGTSAGAINAALIAGLRPNPAGESGAETLKHLAAAPFRYPPGSPITPMELQIHDSARA